MTENNAEQAAVQYAVQRALEIYAESYDRMARIASREGREASVGVHAVAFDIRKNMVKAVVDALSKLRAPVADERAAFEHWLQHDVDPATISYDKTELTLARAAWDERARRAALASAPVAGEATYYAVMHGQALYGIFDSEAEAEDCKAQGNPDAPFSVKPLYAAPQASEAAPFAPDWVNYRQGWADGLAEGNEAIDIARTALMEIADLADLEADQRGVIVNAALTRINEITSRAALSAQPGAQRTGGSDV